MRFDEWRYLYPPRPDTKGAIPPMALDKREGEGWISQAKLNGTCNIMAVAPDRTIKAMGRHEDVHKMWSPSAHTSAAFKDLPGKGWYVFVAELMHSKVTDGPRDTNYINDILVADGEYLVGTRFVDRQLIISDLFGLEARPATLTHYEIDDHTWVARNYTEGFRGFYDQMTKPEQEGIVLKRATAKLAMCSKEASNTTWLLKCRQRGKNFSF